MQNQTQLNEIQSTIPIYRLAGQAQIKWYPPDESTSSNLPFCLTTTHLRFGVNPKGRGRAVAGDRWTLDNNKDHTMSDEPKQRRRHKVEAERTVFTFAVLRSAGWHALQGGVAQQEGSFYEWMTANVFAAFSLEAYLNHLGDLRFKCWEELERLPVESKLALLLEDLKQCPNFSSRPFQTVKAMFRFRNQLAHGRSEQVEETSIQKLLPGESPRYPQAKWEAQCTQQTATRFMEGARAVIVQLHEWAGLDTTLLFSLGEGAVKSVLQDASNKPSGRAV